MVATHTKRTGVHEDTIRVLRAIALMLSTVELDDSPQARRDFRRVADVLVRISARTWARSQRVPDRPPGLVVSTFGPREIAIAGLLAEGKSYKDIAAVLRMGLSSVSTRVKTVYLKLGVHSRHELQRRMLALPGGGLPERQSVNPFSDAR